MTIATRHKETLDCGMPLAVSVPEAVRLSGVGRTKLYEAITSGALRSIKVGKRRLVTIEALRAWLTACEAGVQTEEADHGR